MITNKKLDKEFNEQFGDWQDIKDFIHTNYIPKKEYSIKELEKLNKLGIKNSEELPVLFIYDKALSEKNSFQKSRKKTRRHLFSLHKKKG